MSYETIINEPVKVWAFFDRDVWPIAASWRRRFIKFDKVIFKNTKYLGEVKLLSLTCQSETANFELEYNPVNYSWKLKKIMPRS